MMLFRYRPNSTKADREYVYLPLQTRLQHDWNTRPQFRDQLQYWEQRPNSPDSYDDVYDGSEWTRFSQFATYTKNRPDIRGKIYVHALALFTDGLSMRDALNGPSFTHFTVVFLGLPPEKRYKSKNMHSVMLTEHMKGLDFQTAIIPFAEELGKGFRVGLRIQEAGGESSVHFLYLLYASTDYPAGAYVICLRVKSKCSGCFYCKKRGVYWCRRMTWDSEPSQLWTKDGLEAGVGHLISQLPTLAVHLPYFDISRSLVYCMGHGGSNFVEAVGNTILNRGDKKSTAATLQADHDQGRLLDVVFQERLPNYPWTAERKKINILNEQFANALYSTTVFPRGVKTFLDNKNVKMVDRVRMLSPIGRFMLRSLFPEDNPYRRKFIDIFKSLDKLFVHSIDKGQLPRLQRKITSALRGLRLPTWNNTIVNHHLSHLETHIERFGPVTCSWTWAGELQGRAVKRTVKAPKSVVELSTGYVRTIYDTPAQSDDDDATQHPLLLNQWGLRCPYFVFHKADIEDLAVCFDVTVPELKQGRFAMSLNYSITPTTNFHPANRDGVGCSSIVLIDYARGVYVARFIHAIGWSADPTSTQASDFDKIALKVIVLKTERPNRTSRGLAKHHVKVDITCPHAGSPREGEYVDVTIVRKRNPLLIPMVNEFGLLYIGSKYWVFDLDEAYEEAHRD